MIINTHTHTHNTHMNMHIREHTLLCPLQKKTLLTSDRLPIWSNRPPL